MIIFLEEIGRESVHLTEKHEIVITELETTGRFNRFLHMLSII